MSSPAKFYRPDLAVGFFEFAAQLSRREVIRIRTQSLLQAILATDGLDRTEYIKTQAEALLRDLEAQL